MDGWRKAGSEGKTEVRREGEKEGGREEGKESECNVGTLKNKYILM